MIKQIISLLIAPRGLAWNALVVPTDKLAPAYGSLIYFALDGDTVETVTVSEANMPAGSVFTDWKEIGCLSEGTIEVNKNGGEDIICFDATLGKHVKKATVGETVTLIYALTMQKVTEFILMMSRNASTYNGTTGAFTHNSQADGHYKGYLLISQYQGTELVVTDQFRCELSLSNAMAIHSRTGVKPQVNAVLIDNTNNSGAFGTVTA